MSVPQQGFGSAQSAQFGEPAQFPQPAQFPEPVAVAVWYQGLRVSRSEIQTAIAVAVFLVLLGVPAGLIWSRFAPRREFRVVDGGFQALEPESEALIGADAWLMIITGVLGLLAGLLVWRLVRARGVATLIGLSLGMVGMSVLAWQIGEWLGAGSTAQEQAQLGSIVIPALQLRAIPALVVGAFLAILVYLVMVSFVRRDDLQRAPARSGRAHPHVSSGSTAPPTGSTEPGPPGVGPEPSTPAAAGVTAPPAWPPSDPRPAVPVDPRP